MYDIPFADQLQALLYQAEDSINYTMTEKKYSYKLFQIRSCKNGLLRDLDRTEFSETLTVRKPYFDKWKEK